MFKRYRVVVFRGPSYIETVSSFDVLPDAEAYAARRYELQEPKLCKFRIWDTVGGFWCGE